MKQVEKDEMKENVETLKEMEDNNRQEETKVGEISEGREEV